MLHAAGWPMGQDTLVGHNRRRPAAADAAAVAAGLAWD